MIDAPTPKLARTYKPRDVAERLGVDVGKVLGWIKRGELRALNVVANQGRKARYRITPEELGIFELKRTIAPAPKVTRRRSKSGWKFQYF
ncbi:MAG: helix-turn-helix domain-containing protein [Thermoguttaceae bacterium]|jgi:transposase